MSKLLVLIVSVLLVVFRQTRAYEDYLGVPQEFDDEKSRNIDLWGLTKDQDIWNENSKITDTQPGLEEILKTLCDKFDVVIEDQLVDCNNLKALPKSLHVLRKRQTEEEAPLDEGSGDGEHSGSSKSPGEQHEQSTKTPTESSTVHLEPELATTEHPEHHEQVEDLFQLQSANVVDENAADVESGETSKNVARNAEIGIKPSEETQPTEQEQPSEKLAEDNHPVEKSTEASPANANEVSSHTEEKPIEEASPDGKPAEGTVEAEKPLEHSEVEKPVEDSAPVQIISEEGTPTKKPSEETSTGEKTVDAPSPIEIPVTDHSQGEQPAEHSSPVEVSTEKTSPENTSTIITSEPVVSTTQQPEIEHSMQPVVEDKPDESEKQKSDEQTTTEGKIADLTSTTHTQNGIDSVKPLLESSTPDRAVAEDKVPKSEVHSEVKETSSAPQERVTGTSDKKGRKMSPSNDQSETDKLEAPSVGEAKESVSQKDTKILVGLFGAVIGIGIAAFTYNYIKKKKRSAARNTTNGVSRTDPEEGREMKPLMKNGGDQKQSVDYKNERKE